MPALPVLKIALPVPLYKYFEYRAPLGTAFDNIQVGVRVRVPFGKRILTGIVVEKCPKSSLAPDKLKTVQEILDTEPVFDPVLKKLLFWVARYYQQPTGEVLNAALPKALRKQKHIRTASKAIYRACTKKAIGQLLDRAPKQRQVFELIKAHPLGLTADEITAHMSHWHPFVHALIDKNLVQKTTCNKVSAKPPRAVAESLTLNQEQRHAFEQVHRSIRQFGVYLLAGVTGSGKTEVYLALAKDVIARGKQVLMLVPEIGLTPQLVQRIESRLNIQVALMHSDLSTGEGAQTWLQANTGQASIVVGTRSAIFLPFRNLGLIVVDEEHDLSFKQQEGILYSARDVAVYRAKQLSIPIVLGSATPSLESQHNAILGHYRNVTLSKRAKLAKIPQVKLIDLRSKHAIDGLSSELLQAIETELKQKHQVLLFLNRRGFAPVLLCHDCAWTAECARCDSHMVFYKGQDIIKCHHCQKQEKAPVACPQCGSENLIFLGEGTQRIENRLKKIFPDTAMIRIDRDSTRKKHTLQDKLEEVRQGKHQIIIGTQMLAKGHDFPNVTLVGILNVDHGLLSSDFRASERLAQLIVQVSGRAGRSAKKGRVLLQTHQPEHPLLNRLLTHGYQDFSKEVLRQRERCVLPPFSFMLLVRARAHQQDLTYRFLREIKSSMLPSNSSSLNLFGPIPASLERKAGMYQSQLVAIATSRKAIQARLPNWTTVIQQHPLAKRVRWNIEVDPLETA
ncbi:MAG: primosomal protein N' [Proteobacteria bacterium]|nr:primosomal protein N' [Pseudomonadota bacterium]